MLAENLENIIKKERMKSMNEGKLENKREIALSMITMNVLSDEQISQGVGLPLEEIIALRQQIKH